MSLRTSPYDWGNAAKWFHWLSAALMLVLLGHGWWMTHLAPRPDRLWHYHWHGVIGYYFAALLVLRLVWRASERAPLPPEGKKWEHWAAHAGHIALYLLMVAAVVTGWIMHSAFARRQEVWLFELLPIPYLLNEPDRAVFRTTEDIHEQLSHVLWIVIAVHIAAALRHHFVKRNDVLRRMWWGVAGRRLSPPRASAD